MEAKKQSYWWWFESHNSPCKSQWLQSTLAELDQKTKAMLKVIDQDADSFRQRAEMYYKKRPELVSMVEEFYRAHRSLAEQYEQLKSEQGSRFTSPISPFSSSPNTPSQKASSNMFKQYDAYSQGSYGLEESADSEIDDPEDITVGTEHMERDEELPCAVECEKMIELMDEMNRLREESESKNQIIQREWKTLQELRARLVKQDHELRKLKEEKEKLEAATTTSMIVQPKEDKSKEMTMRRDEIVRLQEENVRQRERLTLKDEEKREAIRQLSLAIEMLREENQFLKKSFAKQTSKNKNPVECHQFQGFGKLLNLLPKPQTSVIPL
ncbi:NETWORKED 3C-like protein [Drosera capensis]